MFLIRPYYRNNKLESIKTLSYSLEKYIIDNDYIVDADLEKALQITINNNACSVLFNQHGHVIYSSDSIGAQCLLKRSIKLDDVDVVPMKNGSYMIEKLANTSEYEVIVSSQINDLESIIYGQKIDSNLGTYYLFVNSPLEPIESVVRFVLNQYYLFTSFILILSLAISLYLASKISHPLIKMKNEAVKLAHGNYDTTFVGSGYSEVNELANTLNDAKDKLSKIDELRRDLIANVSHDLKTPLTMIKAYAEMILDISGDKKEKREEHLNVIIKEVNYLDNLIKDMQELSKMQAGYIVLNKYNFDLSSKVLEVMHLFDVMIHEKSFEVELNVQPDVFVYADEVKIGQVIYNFISNAFKNSDDHTKVTINLTANEDFTRFEVVDQGSGIKEEDLPYIWDRYYKIEKKFIRNHQGTGLGLAIVKAILDAHNIAYGVESEYGKGSIFYFEISNYYDENDL